MPCITGSHIIDIEDAADILSHQRAGEAHTEANDIEKIVVQPGQCLHKRVIDVQFGEAVIQFVRKVRFDAVTVPLVKQLVRASTSIGANYVEADEAGSRKEFRYRISLCNREVKETKHWLRMIAVASPQQKEEARVLWREANELNLIFSAIFRKMQDRQ